jgi:hypothetical protein
MMLCTFFLPIARLGALASTPGSHSSTSSTFTIRLDGLNATKFDHVWEECVGSGHASMTLRQDYRDQLARTAKELGVKRTRFHGLLDDDFSISISKEQDSYTNLDSTVDFHLSIGMEPLFEVRNTRFLTDTASLRTDTCTDYNPSSVYTASCSPMPATMRPSLWTVDTCRSVSCPAGLQSTPAKQ